MKLPAHDILEKVNKEREVSLADLLPLLPEKFNDYRDLFPIAFLCNTGYIKHQLTIDGNPINDEALLASILYSKATGKKQVNKYHNSSRKTALKTTIFTVTSKADLYFAEIRSKRVERMISISIGVFMGVCSTVLAFIIKARLPL